MIDENELEELKEQICRLATTPKEEKWLRDKTDAGEELFGEALDDLRDSKHIKEENGKVTALRPYSKKTAVANYCPGCGARVIGDECPVCKAKVAAPARRGFFGVLFSVIATGIKAFIAIIIILAIIGAMTSQISKPRMPPEMVQVQPYPPGYEQQAKTQTPEISYGGAHENPLFDRTKLINDWCTSNNGLPAVYYFGDGDVQSAEILKMLAAQFPVELQLWVDARQQPLPSDADALMKKYGSGVPMTIFGCRYVSFGSVQKETMPEAAAILCDITEHNSALCQDYTVQDYINQLYARFPR